MKPSNSSLSSRLSANRYGVLLFGVLCLATAIVLAAVKEARPLAKPAAANQVKLNGRLSQTKLVQGELSTVYLDVGIQSPQLKVESAVNTPSDMLIVLDRSGSMSGAQKMPYAKVAIRDLLARLNSNDRFALVSFANDAVLHTPLVNVTEEQRRRLTETVNAIRPAGGTNLSAGIERAVGLLAEKDSGRAAKVVLLSDGQANQGITDIKGLSRIVAQLTQRESVLSTIGMGLDFNETLMSSLADYGMGQYDYLENLATLGELFNRYLNSARQIYATASHLHLKLPQGVELIDAAAYPINKQADGSIRVNTGQLLNNSNKQFIMTFQLQPESVGSLSLGEMHLAYQVQGETLHENLLDEALTLAVVEPQQRKQAVASINDEVYQQSWLKNNLGRMKKEVSHWVREGNSVKARSVIYDYRKQLKDAEQQAAKPMATEDLDQALTTMESSVADAFSGDRGEQEVKRKRAAKVMQKDSLKAQRVLKTQ